MNLIFWIGVLFIIITSISEAINDTGKKNNKGNTGRGYHPGFSVGETKTTDSYSFSTSTPTTTMVVKPKTTYRRGSYRRMAPKEYISRKRAQFEEMKKTEFFHDWKVEQYRCQHGKCAYCRKSIDLHSPDTQVDHVKPFCHYGNNCYDNFVLACKECNYELKKGDYIWTDANGAIHEGWNKPEWIEENQVLNRVKKNKEKETFVSSYSDIPF